MRSIIIASNGVAVLSSILCASHLYRTCWRYRGGRPLLATIVILALTAITSGIQFLVPGVVSALSRDPDALEAGQWWRLVTPLFVQPGGWIQLVLNGGFLVVFLPVAECVFRARIWLIYFVSGVVGQLVNYAWSPYGGGSSTAAFGTMGAVLVCILAGGRGNPLPYRVFAILGLSAGIVMSFTRDGHGPGMLAGALVAGISVVRRKTAEPGGTDNPDDAQ